MIRLFAAVEIPPEIAAGLERRQQGLPGARWHDAEALHLTLRFFGDVSEDIAAEIDQALAAIGFPAFELTLAGVGAFGEGGDVRAVWAGVEPSPALDELHQRCEAVARRVGLPPPDKRTYRPHVTLAYLRRPDPDRVAAWIANHNLLRSPAFPVGWFGLYSSWLSKDGSRYELEREYPLTGTR